MPALLLTLAVVLLGPPQDAMRTAAEHVANEDFDAARRVLDDAYALDPRPELLYSRAQVERIAGNCDDAKRLYEEFAQTASEEDAADARRLSTQCTPATPPVEPPPQPEPPPPTATPEPQPQPQRVQPPPVQPPMPPPPKPWSRRPLPAALMGVGVGAIGAGAGVLGYAAANPPDPAQARDEGDYGNMVTQNRRLQTAGVVVAAVGTGLAVTAGVIWGVLAHRQREGRSARDASMTLRF